MSYMLLSSYMLLVYKSYSLLKNTGFGRFKKKIIKAGRKVHSRRQIYCCIKNYISFIIYYVIMLLEAILRKSIKN